MSGVPVAKSDLEYLQILREVKPYITCIINIHYIGLIKLWLERLSEDFPDKHLRNIYLQRLCKQIEDGVLEYPFTDPPPDGELNFFSDDDNEAFFVAREELSMQQVQPHLHANAQGDGRMPELSPAVEEDTSWVDISDYSSVITSDEKFEQQAKLIEQLRLENKELKKMIAKNDNYIELNQDLTEKVIELQKQLAKAMLRNVELQKFIQNMQEQRERCLKKTTDVHKKEIEAVKVQYQEAFDERERKLKNDVDVKCSDFTKKYKTLQDWYQNKLIEHEASMEEQRVSYQKTLHELQMQLDESEKRYQGIYKEDKLQLEQLDKRVAELKKLLDEEREKTKQAQDECVKNFEAKLGEKEIENKKQLDMVQSWKERFETQAAQFRKDLDIEKTRHVELTKEQSECHQKDLKKLREEHANILEEHRRVHKEELMQQSQKAKDQHRAIDKHCSSLAKQCDHLKSQNHELSQQIKSVQKENEILRTEHKSKFDEYQKQTKDQYLTQQTQLNAHRQQIDELRIRYQEQVSAMDAKHQKIITEQEAKHKQLLEDEHAEHRKVIADLVSAHQQEMTEKLCTQRNEIGDQTLALQENISKITSAHQRVVDEMKAMHLQEVQGLRASFSKIMEEKTAVHRKCMEERHGEQHKLISKLQMLFDDHRQAMEAQRDNLRVEATLKDECSKLCDKVQSIRMQNERSDGEVGRLGDIVSHLRDIIAKMNQMHQTKEKELHKKVVWLRDHFQKFKMIQCNKQSTYTTNENVAKLEAKYKRILLDLQQSAKKEREKYTKKITDLESRLGYRLLKSDL